MAMLDSFFSKGFKAAQCKTLLKLTIPRIKLLRNKREIQIKQMRREIAKLLETGQEATARIRVEHIIREEKMTAAQVIVELFSELISVRLPIIEAQRECPLDLKEAISSLCFAAPRCADLPELQEVRIIFAAKYGKEFVSAATELMPECGVNRQLVELLSVRAPAGDVKLKLMKEIAEEHQLDWDPTASESELLKPHEDLLHVQTHTASISKLPLPEEKHDETNSATLKHPIPELSDLDEDFEIIDFPEVPKRSLQPNKGNVSVLEMLPFPASAFSDDEEDQEEQKVDSKSNEHFSHSVPKNVSQEKSTCQPEEKQFVPIMYPPSQTPAFFDVKQQNIKETTNNTNLDLQDVLAAAQMAAESAERAAVAARSAARIAGLRISELVEKNKLNEETENPFHLEKRESCLGEKDGLNSCCLLADSDSSLCSTTWHEYLPREISSQPLYDAGEEDFDSFSPQRDIVSANGSFDKPLHGLASMDDETFFSYPNLFT
ncbi:regulator of Vps4 activity in the MVB pathway protein [Striga asiatica]|uniref:Regulator of Vps4 activity in the MVB pathway protein n=1 Tax=Striga asiatica TaxID=4170 RepID=A0A5A7Q9R1_STRAF|nr:regulator of Vps4 activity in the MVB pathway protein [Striga asiatica]